MRKPRKFTVWYGDVGEKDLARVFPDGCMYGEEMPVVDIGGFELNIKDARRLQVWLEKAISWLEDK